MSPALGFVLPFCSDLRLLRMSALLFQSLDLDSDPWFYFDYESFKYFCSSKLFNQLFFFFFPHASLVNLPKPSLLELLQSWYIPFKSNSPLMLPFKPSSHPKESLLSSLALISIHYTQHTNLEFGGILPYNSPFILTCIHSPSPVNWPPTCLSKRLLLSISIITLTFH